MEIRDAGTFVEYWQRIRVRTRRVAALIPPDRIEWSHRSGKFTLGDIVRHLATSERHIFVERAISGSAAYPGHGRDLAEGLDDVLAFLDRLHAESTERLAGLSLERLNGKCRTPAGTPITTWKWLRAMVEHEVHHRGQLYLMLGMLDVATPPLYGLTEEDVLTRANAE